MEDQLHQREAAAIWQGDLDPLIDHLRVQVPLSDAELRVLLRLLAQAVLRDALGPDLTAQVFQNDVASRNEP